MNAPRAARVAAAAVSAMATALSGCVLQGEDTSPSSSTSTTDVGTAGRELTEAETKAALPDVPQQAHHVNRDETDPSRRRTDPEQCLDIMFGGDASKRLDSTDHVGSSVYWQTGQGPSLVGVSVSVASYASPVSSRVFTEAGRALGACETFEYSGKNEDGPFTMQVEGSSRATRNFGQQTLSTRFSTQVMVEGTRTTYYIDYLHYRVGHNLVTVRETHYADDRGPADLEDLAQEVMTHLRK